MNTDWNTDRPIPRWLHILAVSTATATFVFLLFLGALVTTLRAGMADPDWPTDPWYLFTISKEQLRANIAFTVEHAHRLAGFVIGSLVSILTLCVWWTERRTMFRWAGLLGLIALLGTFGEFHRAMRSQTESTVVTWPTPVIQAMLGSLGFVLSITIYATATGKGTGKTMRLLSVLSLIAVMIQGLLGGFRVRFDALFGTDLAAVHGVFGQLAFSLILSVAVLTGLARSCRSADLNTTDRKRLGSLSILLTSFVVMQLIWGAMVRHHAGPLASRMHILTAFVVVGLTIILYMRAKLSESGWPRLKSAVLLLPIFLTLQIIFGVEAWMGKFASGVLPELQTPTVGQTVLRSAHVLVGVGILGTSVSLILLSYFRSRTTAALEVIPSEAGMSALPVQQPVGV